ncbi:MAG: 4'-phosphopantetheinyl transferase superfamily protein [Candidatus Dormibacteraeota bacterium]|nr:4'-phosphopantetheinyl transferase superfamily protein [Candidatus Dormibacteraeota bacterium]
MMDRLLPAGVAVVEAGRQEWESEPLPEEARQVARAVSRRQREYAAGRACARLALGRLGLPVGPLLSGPDRAPVWPEGAVGSITHCPGYCAAAVARRGTVRALGIDAELNAPLPLGVAELVCTGRELAWTTASAQPDGHWQALIFSAKESVYKAWQPLTGEWLGYLDVELSIDPARGTFEARLLVHAHRALEKGWSGFRGRFAMTPTHVLTAVALLGN